MLIENQVERPTDAQLADRISRALQNHHLPSLRHVTVTVRGGTVELRGQVGSFYAKQLLQHSARRLAGDGRVIDEVSVVTPAGFRDPLRLRQSAAAGVALLLVLVVGCSKQPTLVEVHPVNGQVLFDGKPAAGATVVFHPKDRSNTFPTPSAKADNQGHFSLTTYRRKTARRSASIRSRSNCVRGLRRTGNCS